MTTDASVFTLTTDRLDLVPMTAAALEAWIDGDAAGLRAETGADFDVPVSAPPLFDEDLPTFRDRMRETPSELGWWVWLLRRRDDARAVGVCGLGGLPVDGSTVIGYSVYPAYEGLGYATEASHALVAWVLEQPGARRVVATIPVGHDGSIAVARKIGMSEVGRDTDEEVGEVAVYRRERG